ncbi:MAG: hypothetical protein KIT83_05645 [Bryobacterales bacterium]|nr:hypothetical protein [Bryobacterales bacterium]
MWKWLTGLFGSQAEEPAAGIVRAQQTGHPHPHHPHRASSRQAEPAKSNRDLAGLRQMLDIFGVKIPPAELSLLLAELQQSRKIEAIKRIRAEGRPRLGLKEAKNIVDAFDALDG